MPRCVDYNSGDNQMGVGYFQRLIHRGYRRSAARVFLHPARATGRLDVRTDARAARILFDGTRATGVRYVNDRERMRAARGVRPEGGHRVLRHRQHGEAAADVRRWAGVAAGRPWRAGDCRSAGGGEFPRPLFDPHRGSGEEHHDDQRDVARARAWPAQIARWAMGKPSILAVSPIDRALVLEDRGHHAAARHAGRVQSGQL